MALLDGVKWTRGAVARSRGPTAVNAHALQPVTKFREASASHQDTQLGCASPDLGPGDKAQFVRLH